LARPRASRGNNQQSPESERFLAIDTKFAPVMNVYRRKCSEIKEL